MLYNQGISDMDGSEEWCERVPDYLIPIACLLEFVFELAAERSVELSQGYQLLQVRVEPHLRNACQPRSTTYSTCHITYLFPCHRVEER